MIPAKPASTVVLLRTEQGAMEVFLVRRHDNIAFMGGAHVFPGGRVDATDDLEGTDLSVGVDRVRAQLADVSPGDAVAFYVAAIRELFEEAGVLLARDADGVMIRTAENDEPFGKYRERLMKKTITIGEIARQERVRLALDALTPIGHWVTPESEPRRFDTRFFLAIGPDGQHATHDDHETTHGLWIAPTDALARARRGEIALPPPTWTTLRALERFADADAAWRWAQTQTAPRVQPGLVVREDGTRLVLLPGDPLCPPVPGFEPTETRFVLKDGRWMPVDPGES